MEDASVCREVRQLLEDFGLGDAVRGLISCQDRVPPQGTFETFPHPRGPAEVTDGFTTNNQDFRKFEGKPFSGQTKTASMNHHRQKLRISFGARTCCQACTTTPFKAASRKATVIANDFSNSCEGTTNHHEWQHCNYRPLLSRKVNFKPTVVPRSYSKPFSAAWPLCGRWEGVDTLRQSFACGSKFKGLGSSFSCPDRGNLGLNYVTV